MESIQTFIQALESVETLILNFQRVRDESTEEQWESWNDDPLLSVVMDSLSDLEYLVNR